jgi:CDP-diacylglycerol--glycerol-3-phosphate 3-phosphatidyltransferase
MTRSVEAAHRRRIVLNLPNILTYLRLGAVPGLVAVMFFLEGDLANWAAVGVFVFAGITDFFDGYLARAWQQQSALGQMLDPIADKLLVGAALLMLVSNGAISGWSIWAAVIILSREILVSGLREFLAGVNVTVAVSQLAKWKTTVQMVALCFLLAGDAGDRVCGCATTTGLTLLWVAALVTLYTGFDYFRAGLKHVMDQDR